MTRAQYIIPVIIGAVKTGLKAKKALDVATKKPGVLRGMGKGFVEGFTKPPPPEPEPSSGQFSDEVAELKREMPNLFDLLFGSQRKNRKQRPGTK